MIRRARAPLARAARSRYHTLILLRHGQSEYNVAPVRFTGWADAALTAQGAREARRAGALLRAAHVEVDACFTSVLRRAVESAQLALGEADQSWVPVTKAWELNERHYGALQGLSKRAVAQALDPAVVREWRRSWAGKPPPMSDAHPLWHGRDAR